MSKIITRTDISVLNDVITRVEEKILPNPHMHSVRIQVHNVLVEEYIRLNLVRNDQIINSRPVIAGDDYDSNY